MKNQWIIDGLKQGESKGKTKAGLAKALGGHPSRVTNLITPTGKQRNVKAEEIRIIAEYLEISPPTELLHTESPLPPIKTVTLLGDVAAGLWREVPLFEIDVQDLPTIQVAAEHDTANMFALRVAGTSINRKAEPGSIVICLKLEAAPRYFREGDWVVVERESGGKIETTIKLVKGREGAWQLWPHSTDPKYQAPVPLGENDGETVRVIGFAIDFQSKGTVF